MDSHDDGICYADCNECCAWCGRLVKECPDPFGHEIEAANADWGFPIGPLSNEQDR